VLAPKLESVLQALGAGVGTAAALGFINKAAHASGWDFGALCGSAGLLAAWNAVKLVSRSSDVRSTVLGPFANTLLLGALLLAGTYLEGRSLWSGGACLAAAAALGALALEWVAARRGRALWRPEALCLLLLCACVALARYSPWNAAIAATAALLPPAAGLLERRALADKGYGPKGTGGVGCGFLLGLL